MQRSPPVLVGRPGECVAPGAGTHHDTYMGDVFSAPPGCEMSAPMCPVCGVELSLVFQTPAPIHSASSTRAAHRHLYLFGCSAEGCGVKPQSWAALRVSVGRVEGAGDAGASADDATTASAPAAHWDLAAASSGELNLDDLDAALDEIDAGDRNGRDEEKRGGGEHGSSKKKIQPDDAPLSEPISTKPPRDGPPAAHPSLAGFYLYAQLDAPRNSASQGPSGVQQAAGRYASAADSGDEVWGGEAWEEDAVLRGDKASDGAYLRFAKVLGRVPDQCARYGLDSALVWPHETHPPVPPCPRCGSARRLEVQLMAPAIAALQEAARWAEEAGQSHESRGPPQSWDWLTAAVFTCARDCGEEGDGPAPEHVALANEREGGS